MRGPRATTGGADKKQHLDKSIKHDADGACADKVVVLPGALLKNSGFNVFLGHPRHGEIVQKRLGRMAKHAPTGKQASQQARKKATKQASKRTNEQTNKTTKTNKQTNHGQKCKQTRKQRSQQVSNEFSSNWVTIVGVRVPRHTAGGADKKQHLDNDDDNDDDKGMVSNL